MLYSRYLRYAVPQKQEADIQAITLLRNPILSPPFLAVMIGVSHLNHVIKTRDRPAHTKSSKKKTGVSALLLLLWLHTGTNYSVRGSVFRNIRHLVEFIVSITVGPTTLAEPLTLMWGEA